MTDPTPISDEELRRLLDAISVEADDDDSIFDERFDANCQILDAATEIIAELLALRAREAGWQAEAERLRGELSAALGYMTNARIDLETGCTKATAIRTVSGGIARARAALHPTGGIT